ncbi:MAG: TIGR03668 family PPOX class F420-dependent oxidoreductase [Chloroflexota bacterium]
MERHHVARLATVDAEGRPHVVPFCYALLDGAIYTPIDEKPKTGDPMELRRIRNILARPEVCVVADDYDHADWSRLAWIQVRGRASLVQDRLEREQAFEALRARYAQYRTMDLESRPLIRIDPRRVISWSAKPGGGD